ncbi:hypothetical protein ACHAWX_003595 [Stephanocyclus meneghinianus]
MADKKEANANDVKSVGTQATDARDSNDMGSPQKGTNGSDNIDTVRATEAPTETNALFSLKTLTGTKEQQTNSPTMSATATDAIGTNASRTENETDSNQTVATVFLKHIISEVVEETTKLQEETACHGPLLDFFNKVELRFDFVNPVSDEYGHIDYESNQNARALDGNIENSDRDHHEVISVTFDDAVVAGRVLTFHLGASKPIALPKIGKGVLLVSNQAACVFRPEPRNKPPRINVKKGRKPQFFLSMFVTGLKSSERKTVASVTGQIKLLSADDRLIVANNTEKKNNALIRKYLLSGEGLNSPHAVFIPKVIKLEFTPMLNRRLRLVKSASKDSIPKSVHVSNECRHAIINAIGEQRDNILLQENCAVKFKKEAIQSIQNMIGKVQITHEGGSIEYDLRDGHLVALYIIDDRFTNVACPAWVLSVATNVVSIDLNMSVSGIQMGAAEIRMTGRSDEDSEEVYYIFDHYAVVEILKSSETEDNFVVTKIAFWLERIEKTLNILGIDCKDVAYSHM